MPNFGHSSKSKLDTCHPQLRTILNRVVQDFDITIVYGQRGEALQNKLEAEGVSKLKYPRSAHNKEPFSMACDVIPYPKKWKSTEAEFCVMREIIFTTAEAMGIKLKNLIVFSDGTGDWAHIELDSPTE